MITLHWDSIDKQSRNEILSMACIQERYQHYEWSELALWLQSLITDCLEIHTQKTVTITE